MSGEEEEDYLWALERLKSLYETLHTQFPSVILTDRCLACMNAAQYCFPTSAYLLCRWHANKAVVRYCQPLFIRSSTTNQTIDQATNITTDIAWEDFFKMWHAILGTKDEESFNKMVQELEDKFLPIYVEPVSYIKEQWLNVYKERLARPWIDQHTHFGVVVTSRVGGIHALLKAYLKRSTFDLFEVWRSMKLAISNQLRELDANQAKQCIRTPINLMHWLYTPVHGWISYEALRKVEEQYQLLQKTPPISPFCTGGFKKVYGLPCVHDIEELLLEGQSLKLEHFHQHWHLKRKNTPISLHLLEPRRRFDPVSARSSIPASSTQRELSGFEIVEASIRPKVKAQPTCSRCGRKGHNIRSKLCPERFVSLLQTAAQRASQQATSQAASITQRVT